MNNIIKPMLFDLNDLEIKAKNGDRLAVRVLLENGSKCRIIKSKN